MVTHLLLAAFMPGQPQPPTDTVVAEVQWIIGDALGDEAGTFGRVTAVASGDLGYVLVADAQGSILKAYDERGRYLGVFGEQGDGPGEYLGPSDIAIASDGIIHVRDSRRVTRLAMSEPWSGATVVDTWPGPIYPSSRLPSRFDDRGRYYYPYSFSLNRSGTPPEHFYLVYDSGHVVDTVRVPQLGTMRRTDPAWVRTGPGGGRVLPGLNHVPFAPVPSWDLLKDGSVVSSDGESPSLKITNAAGRAIGELRVGGVQRRPIPRGERADSLRALEARLDSVAVPLDEVIGVPPEVRRRDLPTVLPEVTALHVDAVERIWVRRWPSEQGTTVFDVYVAGEFVASVAIPADLAQDVSPWIGATSLIGIVRDPEFGVDRVARFDFALG